ncbi:MAG: uracil-DNA glycosylase [Bacteroidetes bacterium RIFCSPLOWO2_12_FULL_35_15]|nr:MAG: uracil-DNA glycosylase [Bacteroidetes bacterium RIFCSPLOWO2_12_FULL_35_15]
MNTANITIHPSWKEVLKNEFSSPYFLNLKKFLVDEKQKHIVYPVGSLIFSAFNHTPFEKVKVVIIGQDPYHGPGQANGLCFSVSLGVSNPPSLKNIFKELNSDLGIPISHTGNLESWADQGILLLNATLTVRANTPGSHQKKGWETFTDAVIKAISDNKKGVIFLLWGNYAQTKEALIDHNKHFILKAAHPSPLARGAFFGCKHFSKTNKLLEHQGIQPIDWRLEK